MHKRSISIQILGSNTFQLSQYRSQISSLLNKEVISVLYDNFSHGLLNTDKALPDILIFLLDKVTLEALDDLTAMSPALRPALLVISEGQDKQDMRLAMQAGARDFFTLPLDIQDLFKSLNKIVFELKKERSKQGVITTVINAKGGAGASFIACNLAHMAALLTDESVVLIDFDLQFGTQALNLDLKPKHTVVEALSDVDKLDFEAIDGYMTIHESGLHLLAMTYEQLVLPGEIPVENLDLLLTLITSNYDRIFIDLPRQIDPLSATILERSEKVVIVVQQSLAHIRDAKRITSILKSEFNIAEQNIVIVVNRYHSNNELDLEFIQKSIGSRMLKPIPNDYEHVVKSTNLGIPLYKHVRKAAITKAMITLAEQLDVKILDEFKDQGFFKRLFHSKKTVE